VDRIHGPDTQPAGGEQRTEGPDHEHLGVGEVDESKHPVDQRVPERDEGVDGPDGDATDGQRPELVVEIVEVNGRPP
jgi:hypothetical protein